MNNRDVTDKYNINSHDYIIDNLLACSERTEIQEKSVFVCGWDEMRSWKSVAPMCCYINAPPRKRSSKANKPKKHHYINSIISISSSNLKLANKVTDCGGIIKKPPSLQKASVSVPVLKNKLSRSLDVLSYDSPSWRFLINQKTYDYIGRCHPKELSKYYDISPRSKSCSYSGYTKRILDPAAFFDERLAASYKAYNSHKPNRDRQEIINKLKDLSEVKKINNRLHPKSFIKLPVLSLDRESDGNNDEDISTSVTDWSSKVKTKRKNKTRKEIKPKHKQLAKRKKKKTKDSSFNKERQKKNSKTILPVIQEFCKTEISRTYLSNPRVVEIQQNKPTVLPEIKRSRDCISIKSDGKNIPYHGDLVHLGKQTCLEENLLSSDKVYLPTLSYCNYRKSCESLHRNAGKTNIKLPSIYGMKIGLPLSASASRIIL